MDVQCSLKLSLLLAGCKADLGSFETTCMPRYCCEEVQLQVLLKSLEDQKTGLLVLAYLYSSDSVLLEQQVAPILTNPPFMPPLLVVAICTCA